MTWNPSQYLKYAGQRLQPAVDLLTRIDLDAAEEIADLGCGTGHITAMLADRFPDAKVVGVDASAEMLARAASSIKQRIVWEQADLSCWAPRGTPPTLLFSNAALHWLDAHDTLFVRLLSLLAPRGILAVQMPHNHGAPSHTAMVEAAADGPWAASVLPVLRAAPVHPPAVYFDILAPRAAAVDLWETEYLHVLPPGSEHPVVAWTRGTALKPLIDAAGADGDAFVSAYAERIAAAYPVRPDGHVLFPFRRLFLVARAH